MRKVFGKQKTTKAVETEVNAFITKQDVHPSDICLYHNKVMSDISDAELSSLITNVYSHQKILTSQKLSSPLGLSGLKSFHGFC